MDGVEEVGSDGAILDGWIAAWGAEYGPCIHGMIIIEQIIKYVDKSWC
jgi:hypothetical protein